jgi:hypothetical protein
VLTFYCNIYARNLVQEKKNKGTQEAINRIVNPPIDSSLLNHQGPMISPCWIVVVVILLWSSGVTSLTSKRIHPRWGKLLGKQQAQQGSVANLQRNPTLVGWCWLFMQHKHT